MKKVLIFSAIFLFFLCPVFIFASGTVDINNASLEQIETLTGIGPVKGQAIINDRPFSSIDDLDRVKGIGSATIQKIKTQGFACVDCQTMQEIVQPVTPTTTPTPTPVSAPETAYPTGVFINELLPNPQGADETEEWIVPTIQQTEMANLAYL